MQTDQLPTRGSAASLLCDPPSSPALFCLFTFSTCKCAKGLRLGSRPNHTEGVCVCVLLPGTWGWVPLPPPSRRHYACMYVYIYIYINQSLAGGQQHMWVTAPTCMWPVCLAREQLGTKCDWRRCRFPGTADLREASNERAREWTTPTFWRSLARCLARCPRPPPPQPRK
jgi:hypothetical protein